MPVSNRIQTLLLFFLLTLFGLTIMVTMNDSKNSRSPIKQQPKPYITPEITNPKMGYPDVYNVIIPKADPSNSMSKINELIKSHWDQTSGIKSLSYKYPFDADIQKQYGDYLAKMYENLPKEFVHGRVTDPLENLSIDNGIGIDEITMQLHDDDTNSVVIVRNPNNGDTATTDSPTAHHPSFERLWTCEIKRGNSFCGESMSIALYQGDKPGYLVIFGMPKSSQQTCHIGRGVEDMECQQGENERWCELTVEARRSKCQVKMERIYRFIEISDASNIKPYHPEISANHDQHGSGLSRVMIFNNHRIHLSGNTKFGAFCVLVVAMIMVYIRHASNGHIALGDASSYGTFASDVCV